MSKRVFVGGLAWATDEAGLRAAFEQFGELEDCKLMTDRETNRSRGFGFVTFSDSSAADAAIEEMNGAELDGRSLTVNEARARTGGRGGFGGGPPPRNSGFGGVGGGRDRDRGRGGRQRRGGR
ncbi:MAG: RNA-binding protein [Proteobacteria bacterium]|nr:RNA-binding protein [Pseudomonadota bacterium]